MMAQKCFLTTSFLYICAISLSLLVQRVSCYKILALALMVTPSHKITFEPLLEELAARGHEVTVVSPIPTKKIINNMREILTFELSTVLPLPNTFEMKERGEDINPLEVLERYNNICDMSLILPQVQELQKEKFDLVIIPSNFNECAAVYASAYIKAPIILVSSVSAPGFITSFYGNPSPISFIPFMFTKFSQTMSFHERLIAFLVECVLRFGVYYILTPSMESKHRQILNNPNLPSIEEVLKNTSLILSNSHFSISYKRPFLPNIIEVGGMHCRPPLALPKELEEFINSSSPHGFILFSMGSTLKASDLPKDKLLSIIGAFSKLKEKVLWKYEVEDMADLPPNVKLSKWLPQQDVLGHPKIKLFITHGGFGSTTEAIYHGVPILGIPMFSDQQMNMKNFQATGIGLTLNFNEFTEQSFLNSILEVLNDPKYKKNIASLSKIFRDQPDKPLDRAVFWTEYVIRHKGAPHLQSAGQDLNFFQYHSLDVIAFLVASICTLLFAIFMILRFSKRKLFNYFCKSSKNGESFNKKRQGKKQKQN